MRPTPPTRLLVGAGLALVLAGCGTAGAGHGAAPVGGAPSTRFALAGMSLTLPVDAGGGTGGRDGIAREAADVSGTALAAGFSDSWFHLDAQGRLVLTAPADGAVTTPGQGSDHVRSELREHYTGRGGVGDDCWTSQLGGTLQVVTQVQAVAAKAGEVTIGQIHGEGGNAFVLLAYRSRTHAVTTSIYPSPGAAGSTQTQLLGGVHEGDTIRYTLAFTDGVVTITVDGHRRTFAEPAWASYPVHFALGAYSAAPNTGNPSGSDSRVAITSFRITH